MQPVTFPLQKVDRRTPPVPAGHLVSTGQRKTTIIVSNSDDDCVSDLSETAYIPESINWRVLTPGTAAKMIAGANEHLSPALIIVRSWSPVGRSGRKGWGYKHNSYVMVDGQANSLRHKRSIGSSVQIRHNGGCQVCGTVFAEYSLVWCLAPDGWVLSCDACAQAHMLHQQNVVSPFHWMGIEQRSGMSSLCEYPEPVYAYRLFVDITMSSVGVEVSNYAETKDAQESIERGIETLRAWVREHSRYPTLEEAAVTLPWQAGENHPAAALRNEARKMVLVLAGLVEVNDFNGLMALVRQVNGGGR